MPVPAFRTGGQKRSGHPVGTLQELAPRHPVLRLKILEGRQEALSSDSINMSHRVVLEPELQAKRLV